MEQKNLENLIVKYQEAYYNGNALVSDEEFDKLWDELKEKYPNSSLLNNVGEDTVKGKKVKHWMLMGSQEKFNTESGLRDWISKENIQFPVYVDYKMDGSSISLQYENGKLIDAVTRGNGYEGESILRAALGMRGVPKTIKYKGKLAVRGEILIEKEIFDRKYSEFKNPRNFVAGTVKNEKFNSYEDLIVISYDCYSPDYSNYTFNTEYDKKTSLKAYGFTLVPTKRCENINDILKYRNSLDYKNQEFMIDGLVIKQNICDMDDLSEVRPKKQHAFKWEPDKVSTVLRNIKWERSGLTYTPVAEFDEILVAGTIVKRASLYNLAFLKELDLEIGDEILICKFGEIIPGVIKNITKDKVSEHYLNDIKN